MLWILLLDPLYVGSFSFFRRNSPPIFAVQCHKSSEKTLRRSTAGRAKCSSVGYSRLPDMPGYLCTPNGHKLNLFLKMKNGTKTRKKPHPLSSNRVFLFSQTCFTKVARYADIGSSEEKYYSLNCYLFYTYLYKVKKDLHANQ